MESSMRRGREEREREREKIFSNFFTSLLLFPWFNSITRSERRRRRRREFRTVFVRGKNGTNRFRPIGISLLSSPRSSSFHWKWPYYSPSSDRSISSIEKGIVSRFIYLSIFLLLHGQHTLDTKDSLEFTDFLERERERERERECACM